MSSPRLDYGSRNRMPQETRRRPRLARTVPGSGRPASSSTRVRKCCTEPKATSAAPTARTLLRSLRLRRLLSVLVGSLRLPWLLAPATFGERDPLRDLDHVLAGRLVVDVDVAVAVGLHFDGLAGRETDPHLEAGQRLSLVVLQPEVDGLVVLLARLRLGRLGRLRLLLLSCRLLRLSRRLLLLLRLRRVPPLLAPPVEH